MHDDAPRIGVVHPGFHTRGGAEAVALNVLEALSGDYEVTLFTTVDPDLDALDDYYGTDVGSVEVVVPSVLARVPERIRREHAGILFYAGLARLVKRRVGAEYDALVSTFNEIGGVETPPTVQYVHCPLYYRHRHPVALRPDGSVQHLYARTCARLAGVTDATMTSGTVVTNSEYMGDVVDGVYGVDTTTVYPPVDTKPFLSSWEISTRVDFVTAGRQTPDKNLLRNVEIVERVRDRGHEVGLTVVGPPGDPAYARRLRDRADRAGFVEVLGELDRPELVDVLRRHRYGLHGKEHEHFGIVVAEMVAAGALPFVPDSGGQREVIGDQTMLTYGSVSDAVDSIDRVLSDEGLEDELRSNLPDVTERFGRERFRRRIRSVVGEALGGER